MNMRERFQAQTHYGQLDRLFRWEMGPFGETLKRWKAEGSPQDDHWSSVAGYDRFETVPVNVGLLPGFEYETLKTEGPYEIYRDGDGVIKKKLKDLPPPAMPQYLEYPLKSKGDWNDFKTRLNPKSPSRFPLHWDSMRLGHGVRDYPLGIHAGSLYGWLRNWMGVEGISLMVYDDPTFLHEAASDLTQCILAVLDRGLRGLQYDFALLWEDMAYKTASLISPQHYRELFLPHYKKITDRLREAGVDVIMLDSDGNVEELIPCWLEVGINFIYPMEVAAGMDVLSLREKFGKALLIGGGMDKRVLATTPEKIRRMVEEKSPLMKQGGYMPGCDHAMPPDIPWKNYVFYRQVLAEFGG